MRSAVFSAAKPAFGGVGSLGTAASCAYSVSQLTFQRHRNTAHTPGASGGDRTHDNQFNRLALYQLSYRRIWSVSRLDCHRVYLGSHPVRNPERRHSESACFQRALSLLCRGNPNPPTSAGRYPASGETLQSCPALALRGFVPFARCGLPKVGFLYLMFGTIAGPAPA